MSPSNPPRSPIVPPMGYEVLDELPTRSRFKVTYRALKHTSICSYQVVLKRYRELSDSETDRHDTAMSGCDVLQMLRSDALCSYLSGLTHEAILPSDLVAGPNGDEYIVEPYLEATLDSWPPPNEDVLYRIMAKILGAVAYIHSRGYLHRDIKPGNIGLLRGAPFLFDFGGAMKCGEPTPHWYGPGSISIRAPELWGSIPAFSPLSDMWSVGATFAFLTTRSYPFLSQDESCDYPPHNDPNRPAFEFEIAARVRKAIEDPVSFERRLHGLMSVKVRNTHLRFAILRCLRVRPPQRIHASELSWDLERALRETA